jgi:hypothetical protein
MRYGLAGSEAVASESSSVGEVPTLPSKGSISLKIVLLRSERRPISPMRQYGARIDRSVDYCDSMALIYEHKPALNRCNSIITWHFRLPAFLGMPKASLD